MNIAHTVLASLAVLLAMGTAHAEPDATPRTDERPAHVDLETDPTAFIMSGYSLHLGLGWKRARLDLGGYGMDLPQFMHGNDGLDVSFYGAGAKLQYFLFAEQKGAFVGVDGGVMRLNVRSTETDASAGATQLGFGVNAGYRIMLPAGFYATPWLGVGYTVNARDLAVGAQTFKSNPATFFPAIHLGYRFL